MDVSKTVLLQLILEDHRSILPKLHLALDYVDESMSDDKNLDKSLSQWRSFFGLWRKVLRHDLSSIAYITKTLPRPINEGDGETSARNRGGEFESSFEELKKNIEMAQDRVNSSFMAIMSTMSIVESRKAISQAEEVSKLTKLAFFFIPLSLSAGIFGMNIVVCITPRVAACSSVSWDDVLTE
jgi:Mg2+ and Co2+ transporter CorA